MFPRDQPAAVVVQPAAVVFPAPLVSLAPPGSAGPTPSLPRKDVGTRGTPRPRDRAAHQVYHRAAVQSARTPPRCGHGDSPVRSLAERREAAELAEKAGCNKFTVAKLEQGRQEPARPLVLALADTIACLPW